MRSAECGAPPLIIGLVVPRNGSDIPQCFHHYPNKHPDEAQYIGLVVQWFRHNVFIIIMQVQILPRLGLANQVFISLT